MKKTTAVLFSIALIVSGCSGMRIVDSDVTAFSTATTPAVVLPAPFRFERLPSQQAQATQSSALEALAMPVLEKSGLRRDDAAPLYSVQLDLRSFRDPQAPWDDPRYIGGYTVPRLVPGYYGMVLVHPPLNLQFEFPYYRRELAIVVRRLSDAQVVFESRARHDGRWSDDVAVLPAMVHAAMKGFPVAPAGLRRVVIEIPR